MALMNRVIEYAPSLYEALNGVFCIYKPAGHSLKQIVFGLRTRLSEELNQMPCRPPKERVIYHEENLDTDLPVVTTVPDLADHPLVVGPRYIPDDFSIYPVSPLQKQSSGVVVMGIGRAGFFLKKMLSKSHPLRVYHIKGELGRASDTYTTSGRTVERSTFHHVNHGKLDKLVAAIQASHTRQIMIASKVDPQSQEAYELACRGPPRPKDNDAGPVIYGMKCVDFDVPNFTLELHAINERCDYLTSIVNELGLRLRTNAICTQVRRIRYGEFGLSHALLKKHWSAQHIANNILFCRPIVRDITADMTPLPSLEQLPEHSDLRLLENNTEDDVDFSLENRLTTETSLNEPNKYVIH